MEGKKDFLSHINGKKEEPIAESFQEEKFEYNKKSYTQYLLPSIVLVLISLTVMFFLTQKSDMIDLTYMTYDDAKQWADKEGVILKPYESYSEAFEVNTVMSQDIEVGQKISSGTTMKLEISKGFDPYLPVEVPNFDHSWSRSTIVNWIDENHIENYSFITQRTDEIPEDYLMTYKIIGADESTFNRSSTIEFTTNEIVETTLVEMGSFLGDTLSVIDIWANNNMVEYTYSYENSDIYAADSIISQSVPSGEKLNINEPVHFVVSSGLQESVEMINLLNTSLVSADVWLKSNRLAYTVQYRYSTIYSVDTIIDSNFYENELIEGSVLLTVSLGEGTLVENFSLLTASEAEEHASQNDLINFKEIYMADTEKGVFISQSLTEGQRMNEDSQLDIVFSLGSQIPVSDFRNSSVLDLEDWVYDQNQSGAGIILDIEEEINGQIDAGNIIAQEMYTGYIDMNSRFTITVSQGLTVPWFRDMSIAEVERFDQDNMIDINIVELYNSNYDKGEYIMQSIHGDSKATSNTVVDVYFSLGNTLAIPDFSGQNLSEIISWVDGENALNSQLTLEIHEVYDSQDYGKIISQSLYNVHEAIDSTIYVLVSKGEAVTIPDFTYYTVESIQATAETMGITVVFEYVDNASYASGRVISQSPEGGTETSLSNFLIIQVAK